MGKFLSGLLFGGLICAFCAVCFLPINIANDIRGWVNKPAIEVVQVDNTQQADETQDTTNEVVNVLPNDETGE